jgi:hypothetical protein
VEKMRETELLNLNIAAKLRDKIATIVKVSRREIMGI